MSKTVQLLTARCGKIRPDSVADYIANGGFSALKKAMSMSPMEIINEVIDAKLLGKNGNSFTKLREIPNTLSAMRTKANQEPLKIRFFWKKIR